MATTLLPTMIGNRWNTLKYLDSETKIDLIMMLTKSLKVPQNRPKVSADKFYGIWGDDGMTAEEFVDAIKAERSFKQDIIG